MQRKMTSLHTQLQGPVRPIMDPMQRTCRRLSVTLHHYTDHSDHSVTLLLSFSTETHRLLYAGPGHTAPISYHRLD